MTKDERYEIESEYCKKYGLNCGKCPFGQINNTYWLPCSMLSNEQFEDVYNRDLERREKYD